MKRTDGATLKRHVARFTRPRPRIYPDEWRGYNDVARRHATVAHGQQEWARDDDGEGVREVHANTSEGMWPGVRNFLRPFCWVHKRYLCQYIAMCEFNINLKRVSPKFIFSFGC